eukprot:14915863-Alexandrium_andersonii.AAC.1
MSASLVGSEMCIRDRFRDDITGAVLPPELVSAARSEEIRFMESWGVWDVRPISECLARAGRRPVGG